MDINDLFDIIRPLEPCTNCADSEVTGYIMTATGWVLCPKCHGTDMQISKKRRDLTCENS